MAKFHYVLMAAVIVMFVFGLFGGTDYGNEREGIGRDGENDSGDYLYSFKPGRIGDFNSTTRTVFHDDSLVVMEESPNRTVKSYEKLEVQRGVFSDTVSESLRFETMEPEAVHISFTAETAQTYGDLVFMVNGHVEKTMVPEEGKRYTVSLENITRGENVLLISAENPGYVFWSPAKYQLSDVEIKLEDMAVSRNTETFRAYDYELSSFDTGTVEFFVRDDVRANEPLRIDINGNNIFERTAAKRSLPYNARFSKFGTDLRQGENTLSIYTGKNSEYPLSNINIELQYYQSTERTSIQKSFNLPLHQYQLIRENNGYIDYRVESIGVAEDLEISLGDREFTESPELGWNRIDITKNDLKNGENNLTISTPGSFEISEFRIVMED